MISQIPKTCFIWLFAAFRWSGNTTIESWSKVSPHQSNHDVRSEFPIKDNFSTGIQTIRKCTRQEGSQYRNMIIKNNLTQTIDGPPLMHMKSVGTQKLPIPRTCVNSKKKSSKLYMVSIFLHFLCQTVYTHSRFYFKKLKTHVILQWEFYAKRIM